MDADPEKRPMEIREHLSQREAAEDVPLLTESAVVTDVTAMDRNRNREVVDAIRETLDEQGSDEWRTERPEDREECEEWLRDLLDRVNYLERNPDSPLRHFLPPHELTGDGGKRLAALESRYHQPYPSLMSFTVESDVPIDFVAGQYLAIKYQGVSRVYSVASSPNREEVEFCISRVPGGELTSELAVDLSVGDELTLRGPYGDLVLESPSHRDPVFLATGTGVAPLKSMIDYLFEEGRDEYRGRTRDVWLFLGAGWEDQLPYREAFRELDEARENFHFVPTLSRENFLTDWTGETDYVQYALAKYLGAEAVADRDLPSSFERYVAQSPRRDVDARLDPSRMEVYACGLNAMVYSLVDAVEALGVPEEHTQFEGFG